MAENFHVKGKVDLAYDRKTLVIACDVVNSKITHVDVSSELMGVLFAGDELVSVNGETALKTTADFNKAITSKLPGKLTIEFMRDDYCLVDDKKLTARRPNSEMVELTLNYRSGAATGLIIHRMPSDPRTVTISIVPSPSNVAKFIKPGDILVKVNEVYVLDRDAARKLIYASVNNTKKVKLTLERSTNEQMLGPGPPPPDGAKSTSPAPSFSKSQMSIIPIPPKGKANKQYDVMLPADVLEIMKANKEFYKKPCKNPPCIVKSNNPSIVSSSFTLSTDQAEVKIPFDPSPKPLKITPKRVGS